MLTVILENVLIASSKSTNKSHYISYNCNIPAALVDECEDVRSARCTDDDSAAWTLCTALRIMSRNDTEREFTAFAIILMQSKPDAAAALPEVVEPVLCVVVVVVVIATLLLPDGWSGNVFFYSFHILFDQKQRNIFLIIYVKLFWQINLITVTK